MSCGTTHCFPEPIIIYRHSYKDLMTAAIHTFNLNGMLVKDYSRGEIGKLTAVKAPPLPPVIPMMNFDIQPVRGDVLAWRQYEAQEANRAGWEKMHAMGHTPKSIDSLMRDFLTQQIEKENNKRAAVEAEMDMPYSGFVAAQQERERLTNQALREHQENAVYEQLEQQRRAAARETIRQRILNMQSRLARIDGRRRAVAAAASAAAPLPLTLADAVLPAAAAAASSGSSGGLRQVPITAFARNREDIGALAAQAVSGKPAIQSKSSSSRSSSSAGAGMFEPMPAPMVRRGAAAASGGSPLTPTQDFKTPLRTPGKALGGAGGASPYQRENTGVKLL